MQKNDYVVAIGSSSLDHYYETDHWPTLGDKAQIRDMGVKVGGLISNAACVMSKCGLDTYMIDIVNSESKEMIFQELEAYGVHTDNILINKDYIQSMTHIYVCGGEKVVMICKDKPTVVLSEEQRELVEKAACVYTILPELFRIDGYEEIINKLKSHGGRLVFDMETPVFSNSKTDRSLIMQADILFFNEMAIEKFRAEKTEVNAVEDLLENGVEIVVITRAERGCSIFSSAGHLDIPGFRVNAVDTTGAGDTFNSVFLTALLRGFSLERCAWLANAGGARAVTKMGPKSGAIGLEEIERFGMSFE